MAESSKVIRFPANEERPPKRKRRRVTNVDGVKYFTGQQIKLLRRPNASRSASSSIRSCGGR